MKLFYAFSLMVLLAVAVFGLWVCEKPKPILPPKPPNLPNSFMNASDASVMLHFRDGGRTFYLSVEVSTSGVIRLGKPDKIEYECSYEIQVKEGNNGQ